MTEKIWNITTHARNHTQVWWRHGEPIVLGSCWQIRNVNIVSGEWGQQLLVLGCKRQASALFSVLSSCLTLAHTAVSGCEEHLLCRRTAGKNSCYIETCLTIKRWKNKIFLFAKKDLIKKKTIFLLERARRGTGTRGKCDFNSMDGCLELSTFHIPRPEVYTPLELAMMEEERKVHCSDGRTEVVFVPVIVRLSSSRP